MTDPNATNIRESDNEIIVQREFDAPCEAVWRAFTDPDQLGQWWGPTGFSTETEVHDLRPGGQWRYTMIGPDGHRYLNIMTYQEIEQPARLVYRQAGAGETESISFTVTATFDELAPDRTRVTTRMVFPSADVKDTVVREYGAIDGARQHMASLAEHLAKQPGRPDAGATLVIRRVLDAPVELVWDAWTSADALMAWFHPEVWKLTVSDMDLRDGGSYHYCMRGEGFPEAWGLWQIRTVRPPERLEFVVSFSDADRNIARAPFNDHWPLEVLSVVTLEPHAGLARGTVMTMRAVPINATDAERAAFRDGIGSMQTGWGQTLDSLVRHLAAANP